MAYEDKLQETQQPTFAELYKIKTGDVTTYYTSYKTDITFASETYLARTIRRSNFKFQQKLRSVKVTVSAPIDPLGLEYVANAPPEAISIKIIRVFIDGSQDNAVIFEGKVISVTLKDRAAHAEVEASLDIFKNKVPRIVFQPACNWMVFDDDCKLIAESWKVPAVVTVSGSDLISTSFGGFPDGYFTMGYVEHTGDERLVTYHEGNTITLQVPFDSRVYTGSTVNAYPGCDGHKDTCIAKFSNYDNFLGFVAIPKTNPVVWGLKEN